jgi:hypothetical protein
LRAADLRVAVLRTADLRTADLRTADLRTGVLRAADWRRAVFWAPVLRGRPGLRLLGMTPSVMLFGWARDRYLIARHEYSRASTARLRVGAVCPQIRADERMPAEFPRLASVRVSC